VDCNDAKTLIHAYADGELGLESALEIERHLEQCAVCTREREAIATLSAALGDEALRFKAPAALRARLGAALVGATATTANAPWWRPRWLPGRGMGGGVGGWIVAGAAFAALALVIFSGSPRISGPVGNGALSGAGAPAGVLAREVLNSHLRSLMAGHLMDVVSTDQHTVKPWFDGRVDFAPPVIDFAADGFHLIGGRLDYLDGRSVAALVYQRRKHIVNVFVWPAADRSDTAVKSVEHDGYNLLHWRRGGMNYWMASDLNAQEMDTFAGVLRAETAAPAPHP
jgi:anti-sigma factor RsiW